LAAEGKTNRKGLPNPLAMAVIARAHFDTVRLPFPPPVVQRAALAVGAPPGAALGYRETAGGQRARAGDAHPIHTRHGRTSAGDRTTRRPPARTADSPSRVRGRKQRLPAGRARSPGFEGDDQGDAGDDAAEDLEGRGQAEMADDDSRDDR